MITASVFATDVLLVYFGGDAVTAIDRRGITGLCFGFVCGIDSDMAALTMAMGLRCGARKRWLLWRFPRCNIGLAASWHLHSVVFFCIATRFFFCLPAPPEGGLGSSWLKHASKPFGFSSAPPRGARDSNWINRDMVPGGF
jgi:hypothetical protein